LSTPFPSATGVAHHRVQADLSHSRQKEIIVVDFTPEEEGPRRGEAVVFWSWIIVLAVGLAYMIAIPLMGR
jgi:hypothetical protein